MMYNKLCVEFYNIDKKYAPKEEIDFYKQFIDKNDLILEPMCGSGRFLIPLVQAGYKVHGLDNSTSMVASCKERANELNLTLHIIEESVETIDLPEQYNAIIIPFGSFQLLYPRSAAYNTLNNFYKHLKPGGKIILDLFIPWDALYEHSEEEFSEREIETPNNEKIIIQSHNRANKQEQFIHSESVYKKIANGQVIDEENEQMDIAWYYRYEMELILEKHGFIHISVQEITLNNENHMIFIGEKP